MARCNLPCGELESLMLLSETRFQIDIRFQFKKAWVKVQNKTTTSQGAGN